MPVDRSPRPPLRGPLGKWPSVAAFLIVLGLALALAAPTAAAAPGQDGAPSGEWHTYGGDHGHTRYSSLAQIDASNAGSLEIAWRWTARNFGPNPFIASQTVPIAVDGALYATAGLRRAVVAIDPTSGETLWTWTMDEGERLAAAPRRNPGRGVSFWRSEAGDARILAVTPGYRLVALDASNGRPIREFGENGVVDLMENHRGREGVPMVGTIGATSPPTVAGDVVVVGSAHHVGFRPPSMRNTPGDVRGFDARTGELLWTFRTIPEAGEFGHESWEGGSAEYSGNAAVWAPITYDPETGYVYLPTEAGTGDYYGGHRHGDNLFSTSLVCLDARTGERVWHFQTVRHDIWDYDNPAAPLLADLEIEGVFRRVVAQITKQGFTFVFDRETGEPVWPIQERAVPQSDVPGERTSPTQPFPTLPEPFDRQGFQEDFLIDLTPEIRERAREVAARFRMGPLYTPPSLAEAPDGTQGTLSLPYSTGGANWEGAAFDPGTGMFYVGSQTNAFILALEEAGDASDMAYVHRARSGQVARGIPIVKPPWGRITAIDLTSGRVSWTVANGDTPARVAETLGVELSDLPRTGKPSRSGLLVTGSLLFAGEGAGGAPILRALDKATGETVAEIDLPAPQTGVPMTYMAGGRQYVVLSVGGRGVSAELVALALPEA